MESGSQSLSGGKNEGMERLRGVGCDLHCSSDYD
jgi:hypothetical protein